MTKHVAFLRGINVGGNKKVSMSDLKKSLETHGYQNIKTLLNSGNIVFEGENADAKTIESQLQKVFEFEMPVILRPFDEIKKLVDLNPFKGVSKTPDTRLYVTFFSEKPKNTFVSPDANLKVIKTSENKLCFVLHLQPKFGTTEAMEILEKHFGKNITTRNWNTVVKIANN